MPSSGTGNSFNADFAACERYAYWAHREHVAVVAPPKPALVVGTAVHAYLEAFYRAQMNGPRDPLVHCQTWGMSAFDKAIGEPEDDRTLELIVAAKTVLPVYTAERWERLKSGQERTLALEWSHAFELPAYTPFGPIAPHLRTYTLRLDRAFADEFDDVCVEDFKSTTANSPKQASLDYYMSDQHLGYVAGWNSNEEAFAETPRLASHLRYTMLRLHPKLSEHSWHHEPRDVSVAQQSDWMRRTAALRARMSAQWDAPRAAWICNTHHCTAWHSRCAYTDLCLEPGSADSKIASEPNAHTEFYRVPEQEA